MYRISMCINNGIHKISFVFNRFPSEILQKKRPSPFIYLVERLRITTKQICKLFRNVVFNHVIGDFNFSKVLNFGKVSRFEVAKNFFQYFPPPNPDHQMKMIRQQAIRVCLSYGQNILLIFFNEKTIIFIFSKYILKPIGMIENMVAAIGLQFFHRY